LVGGQYRKSNDTGTEARKLLAEKNGEGRTAAHRGKNIILRFNLQRAESVAKEVFVREGSEHVRGQASRLAREKKRGVTRRTVDSLSCPVQTTDLNRPKKS